MNRDGFEQPNKTTQPPKMEVAEIHAMMIWSEFSFAETAKTGLNWFKSGLVHKLTNKQHLPHLSFLPLTMFPDPFEITPSWPQLQHGPATLTSPDPTARQLKRAPVHRHHRCCCRWGQASADCGFPSVPAPRPGRLGATASRWIPFFWSQGTGTDPGEIYRWGSSNQHQADGNHQAVGNYHF